MEIKIEHPITISIPDNKNRERFDEIVKHIQEVLIKFELGEVKSAQFMSVVLGENNKYEEAYLSYMPYLSWFYHINGSSYSINELLEICDWTW